MQTLNYDTALKVKVWFLYWELCHVTGSSVRLSFLFQEPPRPQRDMERRLRSASSVDELMSLVYPSYWAALKCSSKLSAAAASAGTWLPAPQRQAPPTRRLRPPANGDEPTFAAAYLNLDLLKSMHLSIHSVFFLRQPFGKHGIEQGNEEQFSLLITTSTSSSTTAATTPFKEALSVNLESGCLPACQRGHSQTVSSLC